MLKRQCESLDCGKLIVDESSSFVFENLLNFAAALSQRDLQVHMTGNTNFVDSVGCHVLTFSNFVPNTVKSNRIRFVFCGDVLV